MIFQRLLAFGGERKSRHSDHKKRGASPLSFSMPRSVMLNEFCYTDIEEMHKLEFVEDEYYEREI